MHAPRSALVPGTVSPRRSVPSSIARPEYVGRPGPARYTGPERRSTTRRSAAIRVAARIAAQALAARRGARRRRASPPTSSTRSATSSCVDHGAYPSTLGYRGFPKSLCTSINEVICHGIPDSTVVEDGDIVNIDITAYIGGVHGDNNATFLAGDVDEESRLLVERTQEALARAIKAVVPGPRAQRHRARHREVRRPVRVRRGPRLHRARRRARRSTPGS